MCARNGSAHSMRYLLDNISPFFPITLQSNMYSRGDSILQAAIESSNIPIVEVILDHVTQPIAETGVDKNNRTRVCKFILKRNF